MSHERETAPVKRGPGRPPRQSHVAFAFKTGDLVLVKWNDGMVYFAKIKRIDYKRHKCAVVFDDKSQDEAHFSQIHSVDETTTDIICIKCKKDDSDKPNEIVLCDTCGIGFHQKCHMPNIPATALELDTPWNCSYCQKGMKCPYLTESLDVLQNLLSEDEDNSIADDVESTTAVDSDHFEVVSLEEVRQPTPRKKKRGRKPAALSNEVKREKRKVHSSVMARQSSSIVTMETTSRTHVEGWKAKPYVYNESDSEPVYISSGKSTPEPPPHIGMKRKKHRGTSPGQMKKKKRSSVESRTVSVTRVTTPICENSSAEEMDTSRDSLVFDATPVTNHDLSSIKEEEGLHEKRPRSLRVSLSIPDDVEPGTPFDKVVKAHQKMASPHRGVEMKELPSWETFADSNVLKVASPKQRPQTLPTEKLNNILQTKNVAATSVVDGSSSAKTAVQSPSAFLASPLPISSSPKLLKTPVTAPTASSTNVKTNSNGTPSIATNVKEPSFTPVSGPPAAVGYSAQLLSGQEAAPSNKGSVGVDAAARPSSLVVRNTPSESGQIQQPLKLPPQSKPLQVNQPQGSTQPQSKTLVKLAHPPATVTPGTTQPSTTSPLSCATKHVSSPTSAAASGTSAKTVVSSSKPLLPPHQPVLVSQSSTSPSLSSPSSVLTPSATPKQVLVTRQQLSTLTGQRVVTVTSSPQLKTAPQSVPQSKVTSQPTVVPQAQHILTAPPSRPSSVPLQHRVLTSLPRPSSVPIQRPRQVLVTQSANSPNVPLGQRVVVGQAQQSPVPVQQVEGTQPHRVARGQPAIQHASPVSTPQTSVLTPPLSVSSSSLATISQKPTQEQQQHQTVTSKKPSPTKSSIDADVIITGVESSPANINNERVGPLTQHGGGERVLLVNSPANEAMVACQQTAGSVVARKVIARTTDAQQMVPSAATNHSVSQVTSVGSHTPVSVVLTPTSSTQVLYHLPDPHAKLAPPSRVIGGAPVHTPPLKSVASTKPTSQPGTSVIIARSPTVTSSNAPVANTLPPSMVYTNTLPASTVYTAIAPQNVTGFSTVSTTKPFAIVNAMPGTQIVYTASQGIIPPQGGVVTVPAGSLPHPPKTYSQPEKQPTTGGKLHHNDVQTISKKIGAAFDSGNEQLLVSAFEDAWKRFQANGKQYEHGVITSAAKISSSKEPPPPNAEVFTLPGSTTRVNIMRQTSNSGNRLLAPKTSSPVQVQQVLAPPPLSSKGPPAYTYTAANTAQQQVYLQPVVTVHSGQQQPPSQHSKIHSSGLFYPPGKSSSGVPAAKKTAAGAQRVVISQGTPVVRRVGSSEKTQTKSRSSSKPKLCSRCGKSATYLCSGCHAEWYCGRDCQLKAWDAHAENCKA